MKTDANRFVLNWTESNFYRCVKLVNISIKMSQIVIINLTKFKHLHRNLNNSFKVQARQINMRLLGNLVVMYDNVTTCCKWKIKNRYLAMIFCCFQIFVTSCSLGQHVYSVLEYRKIFNCHFNATYRDDLGKILAYDIIIYDFGLFNFLLGTDECVANYLDGGYMRCLWCLSQMTCMIVLMFVLIAEINWSLIMCPILLQQSVYSLGLIVLTIATLPKLLNAFVSKLNARFIKLISIFWCGMITTWFFTFTVWHYYWYLDRIENESKARLKLVHKVSENSDNCEVCDLNAIESLENEGENFEEIREEEKRKNKSEYYRNDENDYYQVYDEDT